MASYEIAKRLVARDHEVDVLTTGHSGLPRNDIVDGIAVYRVPVAMRSELATASLPSMLSFLPSTLVKGWRLLRQKHYDVLNSHFAVPSGPTGVILSRMFDTPQVLTIIGGDIYDPTKRLSPSGNRLLHAVVRRVLDSSSHVIAISNDIKRRALEDYGCRRSVEVIHYGLTPPAFESRTRAQLGIPEDDVILISIGRLVKRKALGDLISALSKANHPRMRLLIIGEGPEEQRLRDLAEALGVSSRTEFLGAIWGERKFQYLAASDVFVLPSAHEGFGLAFLEAMYCGLPVIASSTGGQTDFLKDGATGFLVPVGDSDALADRLLRLARDRGLRERMSSFNKEHAKRFHISGVAERYETVFSEVIRRELHANQTADLPPLEIREEGTYESPHDAQ